MISDVYLGNTRTYYLAWPSLRLSWIKWRNGLSINPKDLFIGLVLKYGSWGFIIKRDGQTCYGNTWTTKQLNFMDVQLLYVIKIMLIS